MNGVRLCIGVAAVLSLGACAVPPPSGPSIAAMPGSGKSYEAFQYDDASCRAAATQQTGGAGPAQAATNASVGSAAAGTLLGAAAGALIGSASGHAGPGAAIGAGTGLVAGSMVGANGAARSAAGLQRQYDIVYSQCMFAKGNTVEQAPGYGSPYGAPYGGYYAPRPYPYYYGY